MQYYYPNPNNRPLQPPDSHPNPPYTPRPPQPAGRAPSGRRVLGFVAALVTCTLLSGVLGGILGARIFETRLSERLTEKTPEVTESVEVQPTTRLPEPSVSTEAELSVADIVARATPSVVAINTTSLVQDIYGRVGTVPGAGSGVIIREDGYILTNHHVIGSAQDMTVTLATGEDLPAALVGSDPSNDLAVIKVEATDLPVITTADSEDLRAGDEVIAIGNPFGQLEGSVTSGIISSVNRNIEVEGTVLYNVIQIDAAINSGNSGGALLNRAGELVGINSAKAGGEGVEGIAFAIPTDTALPIAEQLIATGRVQAPEVGISGSSVTTEMQQAYGLPSGVIIEVVKPGSSADRAGLQRSDIIAKFDGQEVHSVQDITALKNRLKPGDAVDIVYYRGDKEYTATLILQEQ